MVLREARMADGGCRVVNADQNAGILYKVKREMCEPGTRSQQGQKEKAAVDVEPNRWCKGKAKR